MTSNRHWLGTYMLFNLYEYHVGIHSIVSFRVLWGKFHVNITPSICNTYILPFDSGMNIVNLFTILEMQIYVLYSLFINNYCMEIILLFATLGKWMGVHSCIGECCVVMVPLVRLFFKKCACLLIKILASVSSFHASTILYIVTPRLRA